MHSSSHSIERIMDSNMAIQDQLEQSARCQVSQIVSHSAKHHRGKDKGCHPFPAKGQGQTQAESNDSAVCTSIPLKTSANCFSKRSRSSATSCSRQLQRCKHSLGRPSPSPSPPPKGLRTAASTSEEPRVPRSYPKPQQTFQTFFACQVKCLQSALCSAALGL